MKIGIAGYGNLGRGVEYAVNYAPDMELVGVFTRRNPDSVKTVSGAKVFHMDDAAKMTDDIDVMIICGGSAKDLPEMTPSLAKLFNVVDSFDTHAKIPTHFENADTAAKEGGHIAVISGGWDPGMFSLNRLYSSCILPDGENYTFWGRGVSQGHSDAIRRIPGVVDARQYTIPLDSALDAVRSGNGRKFTAREMHERECFVVVEEGADKEAIRNEIVNMPNYFADYNTTVHFVSKEELLRDHAGLPHGGSVIRCGKTGDGNLHTIEYKLTLESNPEFTGSVLVALARAAYRMNKNGESGCKTIFDIPPVLLSSESPEELRRKML